MTMLRSCWDLGERGVLLTAISEGCCTEVESGKLMGCSFPVNVNTVAVFCRQTVDCSCRREEARVMTWLRDPRLI